MGKDETQEETQEEPEERTAEIEEVEKWEPSDAELAEAEKELKNKAENMEASPLDSFLAVLIEWDGWENQRITAQENYNLRAELPGLDRNQVVRQYLAAKNVVLKFEKRLVELLMKMDEKERKTLLAGKGAYIVNRPGASQYATVKPQLAERLKSKLSDKTSEG